MRLLLRFPLWLLGRLALAAMGLVRLATSPLRRNRQLYLHLRLDGGLPDFPPAPSFLSRFRGEGDVSLFEVLAALEDARADAQVHGLVLSIRDLGGSWSAVWELRRALATFRAAGKEVIAFADGLDMRGYWLATAADRIALVPEGSLQITGLRAEVMLLRPLLDQLGIKAEFLRAGRYKSYPEMFTEGRMSPELEETLSAILDDRMAEWVEGVASGRGLEADAARALVDEGPIRAERAVGAGLVDELCYGDQLEEGIKRRAEEAGKRMALLPLQRYHRIRARRRALGRPLTGVGRVVVLEAAGAIVEGSNRGVRRPTPVISRDTYQGLLRDLAEDDGVHAVVLRVDSPGGSALTSDLLWREVVRLGEKKPVWVSMGATAASGGYYIAAPAARILAAPTTVTGSIGVVAGKFQGGNLMERVGVRTAVVERGARAGLYGVDRGFTDAERAALQGDIDGMYAAFLDRVTRGRGMEKEALHEIAQGRVWSGAAASQRGLVDAMGGMADAWSGLREAISPRFKRVEIIPVSAPTNVGLGSLVGMSAAHRATRALLEELPAPLAEALELRWLWETLARPGHRALAILPWRVDVR